MSYKRRLFQDMAARPELAQRGRVMLATVVHDDWCDFFRGRSCNCDPKITYRPAEAVQ